MSDLLTVIPYCANDAAQAEQLIDFMFWQNDRQKLGHALLIHNADVHQEMRIKVKISAELAFESVEVMESVRCPTKTEALNSAFRQVAKHVFENCRCPFLWLEPDATPAQRGWHEQISELYHSQPKRYLGPMLKSGEDMFMGRVAVYPNTAWREAQKIAGENPAPFERTIPIATVSKFRGIQQLPILADGDTDKVRSDALLVHGDKQGILLRNLRSDIRVDLIPSPAVVLDAPKPHRGWPKGKPRGKRVTA